MREREVVAMQDYKMHEYTSKRYTSIIIMSRPIFTDDATITQRNERDIKKSGIMQQYSGTPGVK